MMHCMTTENAWQDLPNGQIHFRSTKNATIGFTEQKPSCILKFWNTKAHFANYKTNTRHVCTYSKAFFIVIP